jgi:hypothetical protein
LKNNKKYHTVETVPNTNRKIVERKRKKSIPLTHKYMTAKLSWLGTDTSMKSGGIKLVVWIQTSPLLRKST